MRFTVNRRPAARAPGAVPRPTRTEVNQALYGVIENRVMQFEHMLGLVRLEQFRLVSPSRMSQSIGQRLGEPIQLGRDQAVASAASGQR
jgi:hypothetical protein